MPCCTYLDDHDVRRFRETLADPVIQELLDDANKFDDGRWVVARNRWTEGRLWWKKRFDLYTLFVKTICTEHQQIMLTPLDLKNDLSQTNNRRNVGDFLLGYVAGRIAERQEKKNDA